VPATGGRVCARRRPGLHGADTLANNGRMTRANMLCSTLDMFALAFSVIYAFVPLGDAGLPTLNPKL